MTKFNFHHVETTCRKFCFTQKLNMLHVKLGVYRHWKRVMNCNTVYYGKPKEADYEPVLTRARHRAAIGCARDELESFATARSARIEAVVAATHLTAAVTALENVIGVVTTEDVLERIFSKFCVGK